MIAYLTAPPGADAVRAVDKNQRNDGHVVLGLDRQAVVV